MREIYFSLIKMFPLMPRLNLWRQAKDSFQMVRKLYGTAKNHNQ